MSFRSRHIRTLNYCMALALLVAFGHNQKLLSQSGRRSTKPKLESAPPPQPVNSPNSETSPNLAAPGSLVNSVRLLVGRQPTQRHLQSEDTILASFVNRLNSFANVKATSIGDLKRQEAVIQAKGESESFVVILKFDIDNFQNGTIILNSPDLQIEYQILAPKTGKKLSHGKVYFQSIGGGRMRKSEWPGGTPIKITAEAAGIEAAELVHAWLRLEEVRTPAQIR